MEQMLADGDLNQSAELPPHHSARSRAYIVLSAVPTRSIASIAVPPAPTRLVAAE